MIEIKNLVKRYGTNYALDDVSIEIGEGEIVGLLGPNGAGKSTLMNILTGYLSSSSGSVSINGVDMLENPIEAKKYIGFLPEQPPLYPEMTVIEYLNFVYDLKGASLPREEHISEILSVVKLTELKNRLIKNLSKGNKQRVGIAEALIGDPRVLVFDEPTVGLDPKQILAVRSLLRTLARRHTVILSTHILGEVQAVCERVIIINRGKIIADERTDDIVRTIEDNDRLRVKIVGNASDVQSALSKISGVKSVSATSERDLDSYAYVIDTDSGVDVRRAIFSACVARGFVMIGMENVGTDLETVFIRLVDKSDGIGQEKKKKAKR